MFGNKTVPNYPRDTYILGRGALNIFERSQPWTWQCISSNGTSFAPSRPPILVATARRHVGHETNTFPVHVTWILHFA